MLLGFAENKCYLFLKAVEYSMPTIFYQTCLKGHVSVQVAGAGALPPTPMYVLRPSYYPRSNTFFPASSPREV